MVLSEKIDKLAQAAAAGVDDLRQRLDDAERTIAELYNEVERLSSARDLDNKDPFGFKDKWDKMPPLDDDPDAVPFSEFDLDRDGN